MELGYNARAWSHDSILSYYDSHRLTTRDVYPSEWFFLKEKLRNDISVLDIGCAKGFMATVLSEQLRAFSYVGTDISSEMINAAKKKYPQHRFYTVENDDYSLLADEQFDLVMCVGVLSIHEMWRTTLARAWQRTKGSLIFDLRETHLASVEDKKIAYFNMDFDNPHAATHTVPYNIINAAEAQQYILSICSDAHKIKHYGYMHPVSELAISPFKQVMANVYCIERAPQ